MNTEETINSEYFERKFTEAKKEYNLLGMALYELSNKETKTFDEIIKKDHKLIRLMNKRLKLLKQQRKRDLEESEYNTRNGLPPLTELRKLEDWSGKDE